MQNVIKQLQQIQADAHALYIKVHNFHWNVKGMDFFPVHHHTEKIYEDMSTLYDDVAERIIILGDKPYLTIDELAKATKIKTEKGDSFKSKEIVEKIISEYQYLLTAFRDLSAAAAKKDDKGTEDFANEKIAKLEKDLWMLGNMVK